MIPISFVERTLENAVFLKVSAQIYEPFTAAYESILNVTIRPKAKEYMRRVERALLEMKFSKSRTTRKII